MQVLCLWTLVYFSVMHKSHPVLWDTSARWVPLASQLILSFQNKQLAEARDFQSPKGHQVCCDSKHLNQQIYTETTEPPAWPTSLFFLCPVQVYKKIKLPRGIKHANELSGTKSSDFNTGQSLKTRNLNRVPTLSSLNCSKKNQTRSHDSRKASDV